MGGFRTIAVDLPGLAAGLDVRAEAKDSRMIPRLWLSNWAVWSLTEMGKMEEASETTVCTRQRFSAEEVRGGTGESLDQEWQFISSVLPLSAQTLIHCNHSWHALPASPDVPQNLSQHNLGINCAGCFLHKGARQRQES